MIKKNVPMVIIRIIAFWCQTQLMCIKWGKANSDYFNVVKWCTPGWGTVTKVICYIY